MKTRKIVMKARGMSSMEKLVFETRTIPTLLWEDRPLDRLNFDDYLDYLFCFGRTKLIDGLFPFLYSFLHWLMGLYWT